MTSWCQWVINIVIEVQILRRLFTCLFTHCCLFAIGIRLPVVYLTHIRGEQQYRTAQHSRVAVFKTNGMSRFKLKVLILPTEHWFVHSFIHSVFEWAAAGWSEWHSSWRTPIANHCDEGDWWTHEEMESMFLPNELNCWKEFWWFGKFPFNHCEIGFILNCRFGTFGAGGGESTLFKTTVIIIGAIPYCHIQSENVSSLSGSLRETHELSKVEEKDIIKGIKKLGDGLELKFRQ